jgi:hypothetical protein
MKIVIQTQVRENYGDANKPYWKFKGGNTYVVPNLTVAQTLKIKDQGIPTLTALLEERSQGFEEYVIDWSIQDDDAVVCEDWESPTELFWEANQWVARWVTANGEYGYMRREVASKVEEYALLMGGGRKNYKVSFILQDGRKLSGEELNTYLAQEA